MRHTQIIVEITVILGQNMHYCGKCWLLKSVLIEKRSSKIKRLV
nr:MAG TPA: ubiquitin protein ligase [Caudoviricetes sp.]